MRRRRATTIGVVAGLTALVVAGAIVGATLSSRSPQAATPGTASSTTEAATEPSLPAILVPPKGTTLIANITAPTPDFSHPVGPADAMQIGTISTRWHGSRVALPVIGQQPGWLEVRLPQRPNGQTAWIRSTEPHLSYTGYSIVVNTTTTHLRVYLRGTLILNVPAGIGAPSSPTPLGHFFIAYLAQAPNPGYGPFVIVTSAHSNAITDWEASGDAEIGIHGPLGQDAAIGTKGAHISHGCVRLHVSALAKLRDLPLGTPVTITN